MPAALQPFDTCVASTKKHSDRRTAGSILYTALLSGRLGAWTALGSDSNEFSTFQSRTSFNLSEPACGSHRDTPFTPHSITIHAELGVPAVGRLVTSF